MRKTRPQKQLLQLVMLSLLSVCSVLVMANESFAALDCTACHGSTGTSNRPVDTPPGSPAAYRNITTGAFKGNHTTHLGATPAVTDCTKCHNNTGYTSSHRNGGIDMAANINTSPGAAAYSKGVFFNQTSIPTLGTCATTNCHFQTVTPTWGADPAATNCDTCHSSVPATLSHLKHTTQYGGTASCTKCHTDHAGSFQHATSAGKRSITLITPLAGLTGSYAGGNGQYLPSQSATRIVGSCSTTYCHSSGQANGGIAAPTYATPQWGSTTTCTSCHDVAGNLSTGTHVKHVAKDANCGNCHTGATATTYASANHVDGFINVSGNLNVKYSQGRSSAPGNGYGTCNNASCHAAFTNVAPNTLPNWGTTAPNCSYCHQGTPNTGAHPKHLAIPFVAGLPNACDYCHTAVPSATHIDGSVNVLQMAGPVAKHASGAYTATCTTTCHTPYTDVGAGVGVTPTWGVVKANNCGLCHEVSPTTGVHARHLANTALITDCSTCHTNAVANTSGGTGHMNGTIDVTQYTGGGTAKHLSGNSNYNATCTTACHNPTSTTVAIVTPNWGITTPSCADCHNAASGDTFDATGGPTTGSHSGHMSHTNPALMSCAKCHIGAVANSNGGTSHLSGMINVSSAGTSKAAVAKHTSGSGYMSCTATCHNGVAFTAPALTWGATLFDCSKCHGYPPAGPSHTSVNPAIAGACNSCHSEVATTTIQSTPIGSAFLAPQLHMNGVTDGGRCDACHGYPPVQSMLGKGVNINYSSAKLENYSGGGGAHSVAGHLALTLKSSQNLAFGGGCSTCHPSNLHNQGAGTFLTTNVQVVVDPKFKFDSTRPIVYSGKQSGPGKITGTCSNVACHFKPSPIWSTGSYTQGH